MMLINVLAILSVRFQYVVGRNSRSLREVAAYQPHGSHFAGYHCLRPVPRVLAVVGRSGGCSAVYFVASLSLFALAEEVSLAESAEGGVVGRFECKLVKW